MKEKRYFCDYFFEVEEKNSPRLNRLLTFVLIGIIVIGFIFCYSYISKKFENELNSYSESTYVYLDEIANKVNMDIDTDNNGTLAKVKYSSLDLLDEPIIIDIVNFIPLCSCQPNERLLGPRRNDESYRDCIERNWDNFGTDLPSKLAQTFNPGTVLAAISITCLGKTTTVEG